MFRLATASKIAMAARSANRIQVARFAQSAASAKLVSVLENETKHEKESYELPPLVKLFTAKKEWIFEQKEGDVNMALTKTVGNKTVRVDWQLVSPFNPDMDPEMVEHTTDFCVSLETREGAGITFYCSTQKQEDHRFMIGACKAYASATERDLQSAYNGPEFQDLDENLQVAFDEYLGEIGFSDEVFDFIDATSADKEQSEYIRWLSISRSFFA